MDKCRFCIILCCLCICTTTLLAQKAKKKKVINRCSFIEKNPICNQEFWFPQNSSTTQESVIKDAKSAAMIAYVYVANLYGVKIAKIEQPYSIYIVNDSLWMVSGTSKPRNKYKQWKGNFYLVIDKKTGRIVSFMHDK